MDDRIQREQDYHDRRFASDPRAKLGHFYAALKRSNETYRREVFREAEGLSFLEYGCGTGSQSFDLVRSGATVTGIDISQVAIERAVASAKQQGIEDRIGFRVMNAEQLDFPEASFDRIVGSGILHHLELDKALSEIQRVLKPAGVAVFREPMHYHPLLNLYRRLTPKLRSVDEHPLRLADLRAMKNRFSRVEIYRFDLLSPFAAVLQRTPLFIPVLRALEGLDRLLLALPGLRNLAWQVVLVIHRG